MRMALVITVSHHTYKDSVFWFLCCSKGRVTFLYDEINTRLLVCSLLLITIHMPRCRCGMKVQAGRGYSALSILYVPSVCGVWKTTHPPLSSHFQYFNMYDSYRKAGHCPQEAVCFLYHLCKYYHFQSLFLLGCSSLVPAIAQPKWGLHLMPSATKKKQKYLFQYDT